MTPALQGIMKRVVPFDEWHEQDAWIKTCPQCSAGQAMGIKEMPQSEWGDGLGAHENIREIISIVGSCEHFWQVLIGQDERRVLFYFV